jgi:Family of unknown function (DUF6220)
VTTGARYIYIGLVWLFLVAITIQVLIAGLAIFGDPRDIDLHRTLGYLLHLSPVLILIAAAVGRVGRTTLLWVGALVVVTLIQPLLPAVGSDNALVAALHPVLALVIFAIAARLAWASPALLPGGQAPGAEVAH